MSTNKLQGTMEAYKSMVSQEKQEVSEARMGNAKTFKDLESWVMAVVDAGGSISKRGNNLVASDLASRSSSATFELKKGRGSLIESVEEVELELEEKKLDPVNDKENDKKFDDRKDKDIDNDGDVDSSDEYLHKKRAATDDAIDGGDKPAKDEIKKNPKTADKKAEISKIGESIDTREAFLSMWAEFAESIESQKKGATKPEEIDSKESPKSKEFTKKHKIEVNNDDEEGHDMAVKAGRSTKQAPKN